jgi:hypothetical protein
MGRGFMAMMSAMAEDERLRIIKRTHEGRQIAPAKGVRMGRKPKLTPHQIKEARQRLAKGEPTRSLAKSYGVSISTIFEVEHMKSAWVITREGTRHATEVIGILSARKSANTVREYVGWLYALLHTSPRGHFDSANYKKVPYPCEATFMTTNTGVPVDSRIICGDNPYIAACRAINVTLIDPDGDKPSLQWITPEILICDPQSRHIIEKKPGVMRKGPIHLPIRTTTSE